MQESSVLPNWLQSALSLVASFLAGGTIVKLIEAWLNRKRPSADIHLTEATTAEIHVRAGSSAGDAIVRFMNRLDEAQITIDRLRQERDAWQDEYDKEFTQRKLLALRVDLLTIEADSLRDQMEGAYNYIKFLGRHPTDVDRFRVQLKSEKDDESN